MPSGQGITMTKCHETVTKLFAAFAIMQIDTILSIRMRRREMTETATIQDPEETLSESPEKAKAWYEDLRWEDVALAGAGALGITALTNFVTSFISDPEERSLGGTLLFGALLPVAALVGGATLLYQARPAEKMGNWFDKDLIKTTLETGEVQYKAKAEGGDITQAEFDAFYNALPEKDRLDEVTKIKFDDAEETVTVPKGYEIPAAQLEQLKKAAAAPTP